MFVFFAHLAWALSVNDTAYEHQRKKILAVRPSVSPSLKYPLHVITVTAASSLWTWGRKRALMLCLCHRHTLAAGEVWEICTCSLRMGIQLLNRKEVANTAQPILIIPLLINKIRLGTDCWLQCHIPWAGFVSTVLKIRSS